MTIGAWEVQDEILGPLRAIPSSAGSTLGGGTGGGPGCGAQLLGYQDGLAAHPLPYAASLHPSQVQRSPASGGRPAAFQFLARAGEATRGTLPSAPEQFEPFDHVRSQNSYFSEWRVAG